MKLQAVNLQYLFCAMSEREAEQLTRNMEALLPERDAHHCADIAVDWWQNDDGTVGANVPPLTGADATAYHAALLELLS